MIATDSAGSAPSRIVLVGFSGTGKSTVGRLLAARLGWTPVDTDVAIEAEFGTPIPEIFATRGEPVFRAAERSILAAALARDEVVVACGGGAVADSATWGADLLGRPGTLVVALDAQPATMLRRLSDQQAAEGAAVARPMLAGNDPLARIAALKANRQPAYDRAAITFIVDTVSAEAVVDEIAALLDHAPRSDLTLTAPSGSSAIVIGPGRGRELGELARARWPAARRAWLITDAHVGPLHAEVSRAAPAAAGFETRVRTVAAGEGSKSLTTAGDLYDWLLEGGIERGDVIIALGGGVIGDLVGFVAATCLRGVGLVQVPTTLVAMVDSSVGGKTGINHRTGKNLIGAFYQPPLVVIDPRFLRSLPERELTSGWAEIVKHGIIQRSTPGGERNDLTDFLERNAGGLRALGEPALSYLIRRNVALKAAVVAADEREAGLRSILNFGHTLGHGIEAAGYRYLHGEAIAVGMRAAARLGAAIATCDAATVSRLGALLDRFGLPSTAAVDLDQVLALTTSDKKRSAGRQRWILPVTGGGVVARDDVPEGMVREALMAVIDAEVPGGSAQV